METNNQVRIIASIAVGIVGILIGAIVLILLQRTDISTEPATEPSIIETVEETADELTTDNTETITDALETSDTTDADEEKTTSATGETLPPVTDSPEGEKFAAYILGEWVPESAYLTETEENIPLTDIYGQGYKTYGGLLVFNSDNTFSINVGITDDGDSNNGKYSCIQEKISVIYNNDREDEFIPHFSADGSVESILVPQWEFTVVFVRSVN